jgi:hypothetical protein
MIRLGQLEQLAEADHVAADGNVARHRRDGSDARTSSARGRRDATACSRRDAGVIFPGPLLR